jgi:hypothetical protein
MLPGSDHYLLPAPLLTPKALCAQLAICPRTYSRLVRAGMPHVLVLTARRYDVAEVVAWLRTRSVPVPATVQRRTVAPQDDQLVRHLKLLARGGRR